MNDVWIFYDQWNEEIKEYYDCEETAWLAYCKWCKIHDNEPDEEIFKQDYIRLSDIMTIITAADVERDDFIPA